MSRYSQSTLDETADLIGEEPISAFEMCQTHSFNISSDALNRRLAELTRQGVINRRWVGNNRFGKYVYFRRSN